MAAASIMSDAGVQSKIFGVIAKIDAALHDAKFLKMVRDIGADASSFRFFMKGSSAVRIHLAEGTPVPLASDIDMVLLIDPTLSDRKYRALRALLIVRLLDVAGDIVEHSSDFFDKRRVQAEGHQQLCVREFNAPNKDDLPSYLTAVFSASNFKAPANAGLRYKFVNSLFSPGKNDKHEKRHISLLKFIPRLHYSNLDSVLDIIIPTTEYKRGFNDWVGSEKPIVKTMYGHQVSILKPYALDLDLRASLQTESREEKLANRMQLIRDLEFSQNIFV
jgi:hypothetical protein